MFCMKKTRSDYYFKCSDVNLEYSAKVSFGKAEFFKFKLIFKIIMECIKERYPLFWEQSYHRILT